MYWAAKRTNDNVIASAIKFEKEAYYPRKIYQRKGAVLYKRKVIPVPNVWDFTRHRVLQSFCGSSDINQAMVKNNILFGIDAADCFPYKHSVEYWHWYVNEFKTKFPWELPVVIETMRIIAERLAS